MDPAPRRRAYLNALRLMPVEAAKWIIAQDELVLASQGDSAVRVSAAEVFAAAFRGAKSAAGYQVENPITQLPDIAFSPVAAQPAIRLTAENAALVRGQFGVVHSGGFSVCPDDRDHVVSQAMQWLPVDRAAIADTKNWLGGKQIDLAHPLTLRAVIQLRTCTDAPFRLLDLTTQALAEHSGLPIPDISGLQADLYPYQAIGVAYLAMISAQSVGCVLGDEMGLGKTLQIIALFQAEQRAGRGPNLVVAPATLLENWRRETLQFAPGLKTLVHSGRERAGIPALLSAFDLTVTSYETLIRDAALFNAIDWNIVALDEAQNVKNPFAQRTLAAKALHRRVSVAVTGTPVENRLEDLWSLADFCLPELLGTLEAFHREYENRPDDASTLGRVVAPVILRRRLAEVANDLPALIDIPQPICMSDELATQYEAIRREAVDTGDQLAAVTRLRQLCAHPALLIDWPSDPAEAMPKYRRTLEVLEEAFESGEKVLIFAGFTRMIDLLVNDLRGRWARCFVDFIDGRTDVPLRQTLVDEFSSFTGPGALVLNPKAAGTGLNITAANHVIHYTPEWNPAVTAQASARAYRRRQRLPVTVHRLYFVDSVEEVMVERAALKESIAAGAVVGHTGEVDASTLLDAIRRTPVTGGLRG